MGSIPGPGRSSGEGHGNPLQYSCLENPMDRGARWATVRGDTKSPTQLKRRGKAEGMKQHQLTFLRVLVETATEERADARRGQKAGRPTRSAQSILVHANGRKSEAPFLTPVLGRRGQKMRQENDRDTLLMNYCWKWGSPLREQLKYGLWGSCTALKSAAWELSSGEKGTGNSAVTTAALQCQSWAGLLRDDSLSKPILGCHSECHWEGDIDHISWEKWTVSQSSQAVSNAGLTSRREARNWYVIS